MNRLKFGERKARLIPENWEDKRIGDCIELLYGKGLTKAKREPGDFPVYGSNGLVDYHSKAYVKGPGIIVGRKGSVGEVSFSKGDFWPIDTTYYVKVKKGNNISFWFYFLKTLRLNQRNTHSAVPGLNRNDVYEIEKKIPGYSEQKDIAKILSDLDSKIEFSNKMNKTLEVIGQALFKRWFVDFEFPNNEGKPYKSSGGEMVDAELGEIPKGWEIREIKDCGKVICGKTPSTRQKENYGDDIAFITIPDMRNQTFVVTTGRKLSHVGAESQKKKELSPLSVCVSCIATPGLVSLTCKRSHTNQQINSIICNENINPYFMYYFMVNKSDQIKTMGLGGTATLNLNTGDFSKIKIIVPDKIDMLNFGKLIQPIFNRILGNIKENLSLSEIRDSFLPRLMSGRSRVSIG